jgi:hypothetical protein
MNGKEVALSSRFENGRALMTFDLDLQMGKGDQLQVTLD